MWVISVTLPLLYMDLCGWEPFLTWPNGDAFSLAACAYYPFALSCDSRFDLC